MKSAYFNYVSANGDEDVFQSPLLDSRVDKYDFRANGFGLYPRFSVSSALVCIVIEVANQQVSGLSKVLDHECDLAEACRRWPH